MSSMPPHLSSADVEVTEQATPALLCQVRADVVERGWFRHDHSTLEQLVAAPTTRGVFLVDKQEGRMQGAFTWHVVDELVWGLFLTMNARVAGRGHGLALFTRGVNTIRQIKDRTFLFRSVPAMSPKYQQQFGTHIGRYKFSYNVSLSQAEALFSRPRTGDCRLIGEMDTAQFNNTLLFDQALTGRDRSAMLRRHWAFPFTEGSLLLHPSTGSALAYAGMCTTGLPSSPMYKLSPIYAPDLSTAAAAVRPLLDKMRRDAHSEPRVLIDTVTESKGWCVLDPLLRQLAPPSLMITHMDRPIPERADREMLIVPHDNSAHYDA